MIEFLPLIMSAIVTYPRVFNSWQNQVRDFVQCARLCPEFDLEQVNSFIDNKDQPGLISLLITWVRHTHPLCLAPPFMEEDWTPVVLQALQ